MATFLIAYPEFDLLIDFRPSHVKLAEKLLDVSQTLRIADGIMACPICCMPLVSKQFVNPETFVLTPGLLCLLCGTMGVAQ